MARARNIKPGFFKNEELAECSPWARLCFIGLWTLADREGRLEDRPRRIKGELFPLETIDVEPLLAELARHGFILRYPDGNGRGLIQVVNFAKHQNPHRDEKASTLPNEQGADTVQARCEDDAGTVAIGLIPDPLNPDPRSLKPDAPTPLGKASGVAAQGFADFWAAYPRKVCKADAMKAFTKLKAGPDLMDVLMQALKRQRSSEQWRREGGQYIPHPATWLNGRRWEDESGDAGPINTGPPDDTRPPWALSAGFANRYEAENAACFEHNHHQFADGRRRKETA